MKLVCLLALLLLAGDMEGALDTKEPGKEPLETVLDTLETDLDTLETDETERVERRAEIGQGYKADIDYDVSDRNPYSYKYNVADPKTFNNFEVSEEGNPDIVTGSYKVDLPDGRTQIVSYRVHPVEGYQAEVNYIGQAKYPDTPGYKATPYGPPEPMKQQDYQKFKRQLPKSKTTEAGKEERIQSDLFAEPSEIAYKRPERTLVAEDKDEGPVPQAEPLSLQDSGRPAKQQDSGKPAKQQDSGKPAKQQDKDERDSRVLNWNNCQDLNSCLSTLEFIFDETEQNIETSHAKETNESSNLNLLDINTDTAVTQIHQENNSESENEISKENEDESTNNSASIILPPSTEISEISPVENEKREEIPEESFENGPDSILSEIYEYPRYSYNPTTARSTLPYTASTSSLATSSPTTPDQTTEKQSSTTAEYKDTVVALLQPSESPVSSNSDTESVIFFENTITPKYAYNPTIKPSAAKNIQDKQRKRNVQNRHIYEDLEKFKSVLYRKDYMDQKRRFGNLNGATNLGKYIKINSQYTQHNPVRYEKINPYEYPTQAATDQTVSNSYFQDKNQYERFPSNVFQEEKKSENMEGNIENSEDGEDYQDYNLFPFGARLPSVIFPNINLLKEKTEEADTTEDIMTPVHTDETVRLVPLGNQYIPEHRPSY